MQFTRLRIRDAFRQQAQAARKRATLSHGLPCCVGSRRPPSSDDREARSNLKMLDELARYESLNRARTREHPRRFKSSHQVLLAALMDTKGYQANVFGHSDYTG